MEVLARIVLKNSGELMCNVKLVKDSSEESTSPNQDLNEGVKISIFSKGSDGKQNIQ